MGDTKRYCVHFRELRDVVPGIRSPNLRDVVLAVDHDAECERLRDLWHRERALMRRQLDTYGERERELVDLVDEQDGIVAQLRLELSVWQRDAESAQARADEQASRLAEVERARAERWAAEVNSAHDELRAMTYDCDSWREEAEARKVATIRLVDEKHEAEARAERLRGEAGHVAADIRFAIRNDAHRSPIYGDGHTHVLETCAERLEALASDHPAEEPATRPTQIARDVGLEPRDHGDHDLGPVAAPGREEYQAATADGEPIIRLATARRSPGREEGE